MGTEMPWDQRVAQRLRLRDLYVLHTAAQLGSMGKAAVRLAVSQPAVSKAIRDLEHVLGTRLLDRTRQGVEPTQYGTALLKWSAVVFDTLRQGVEEIDFLADPTGGEVRVGSTDIMMASLLPAVIDRLSRQFPKMVFKVSQAPGIREQFHDLRARRVDLILGRIIEPKPDEDLDVEILFEDPLFVVAGQNSKWHRRRKINAAELIDEPGSCLPMTRSLDRSLRRPSWPKVLNRRALPSAPPRSWPIRRCWQPDAFLLCAPPRGCTCTAARRQRRRCRSICGCAPSTPVSLR